MAVTLATIVDRVQRYVIDAPTNVTTDTQFWVLQAHHEIQELHNFHTMYAVAEYVTTAGSDILGTIEKARFKEWAGDPFIAADDFGNIYPLKLVLDELEGRKAFNTNSDYGRGRPRILFHRRPTAVGDAVHLNELRLYPVPDGSANTSTGEYGIRTPYFSYLATPTSSDWFTDNATDFLTHSAVAQAFAVNWDEQRYLFWRTKAYGPHYDSRGILGGDLLRAINLDKQLWVSGLETMVPYDGARDSRVGL